MKLAHLFILICFANAAFSQVPTTLAKDSLANDTTDIADAPDIDPEFTGGYEKLSTYIGKELKWDEVEKWTAKKKLPEKNRSSLDLSSKKTVRFHMFMLNLLLPIVHHVIRRLLELFKPCRHGPRGISMIGLCAHGCVFLLFLTWGQNAKSLLLNP